MEALPKGIQGKDTTIPVQAIEYINKLFELEKNLEVLSPVGRKEQRLIQEKPVLEAFWSWTEKASERILPQSKLGAAFTYASNQKEGLMNYLLDGSCAISNNLALYAGYFYPHLLLKIAQTQTFFNNRCG